MISLKKNDKIIIIVAVVILIIAGVGVAMYQSPKTPPILPSDILGEKSYDVNWTVQNGSLSSISEFAGKKSPYEGTVMISEGNIKSITFNLSWTDDRMTLLKRMGLDSLTLEVTTPDGIASIQTDTSARITGKGAITITLNKGIIPPKSPIKAVDEQEAKAKLKQQPYYDDSWTDKDIAIVVSVKIGEIRLLKQLRDKGNSFELMITYDYYEAVLSEDKTKGTGGEFTQPPDEDHWTDLEKPPYISMIISTGCGRYV
ncbi:hypothetical protein AYK25_01255 [Thermoplasmatales archaeon SM1-50]|nr:MAG: hypothetical protein AYK25_01255 [Thermoplasmatales archaeon SM1-50]